VKILVVDDNTMNLELTRQLLNDDHEVLTANNGAVAVETASTELPDLVLMDLSMPVMDGWEATRRLRAAAETAHIPVIALTAHAIAGEIEKALEAGCIAVVTKPIDEDELFAAIAAAFK
jgi:two-component system cell cycle response regulator DivK